MVVLAIVGILAAVAIPSMYQWLPGMRLKSAARDVYSSLQKARMQALTENREIFVRFENTGGYLFFDLDDSGSRDSGEYTLYITGYKSGVSFGKGTAVTDWNGVDISGPLPASQVLSFSNRGTAEPDQETVYLHNEREDDCYAITTLGSGSIKLRRYSGSAWMD